MSATQTGKFLKKGDMHSFLDSVIISSLTSVSLFGVLTEVLGVDVSYDDYNDIGVSLSSVLFTLTVSVQYLSIC